MFEVQIPHSLIASSAIPFQNDMSKTFSLYNIMMCPKETVHVPFHV